MSDNASPPWRVRRTGGVLVPGFRKRFSPDDTSGVTSWCGIPIGRFSQVAMGDGSVELRYRSWPIVDVLRSWPSQATGPIEAAGFVRAPGGRRVRFCTFRLDRPAP